MHVLKMIVAILFHQASKLYSSKLAQLISSSFLLFLALGIETLVFVTIMCLLSVHLISFSNNKIISILWRNDFISMPLVLLLPNSTKTKPLLWSCAKSLQSCPALHDCMDCSLPGSLVHGDPPGKSTGVDRHALLQGIFSNQGLNPRL